MNQPHNKSKMNGAELLVYRMCRHSFLSLWSYMNPRKKPQGKELCDVLVVCEPDVIIFSVKQIRLTNSGKPEIDAERWRRRAIDESCKQIYGAERILRTSPNVIKSDSFLGVPLPSASEIRSHRAAVAYAGQTAGTLRFRQFRNPFTPALTSVPFLHLP